LSKPAKTKDEPAPTSKLDAARTAALEKALDLIKGKHGNGAIMCYGNAEIPKIPVIPTGILPLDVALTVGGLPKGRVVEFFGPEGSGKTTVALHAIAEAQKQGDIVAFIDAEHALDPRLAMACGVDMTKLYMAQPDSGEQALDILEKLVNSSAVGIVVVDSVAALTPQAEIDGNIGDTQVGLQARLMSGALRKLTAAIAKTNTIVIFINQLRAVISTGYGHGPTETTTGGRALKFYSSVRVEIKRGKAITAGDRNLGHELWMKVVKNKVAPPFRTAHAALIYGSGVPRESAVLEMALDHDVIKRRGSWLAYKGENLGQGKEKVAAWLKENPDLMKEISDDVLAKVGHGGIEADPSPFTPEGDGPDTELPPPEDGDLLELEEEA
jgi:recombination protein RecA